jgi:hypothetical protein
LSLPHTKAHWRYDKGSEHLLCVNYENTEHNVYMLRTGDREMRSVPVYTRDNMANGPAEGTHHASVTSHGVDRIKMHLRASVHVEPAPPNSFLGALRSFPNQKMWNHMYLDEDGEWIVHALLNGTLDIAHNGSYQPEITKEV